MHMKPYYYYTKDNDISYLEIINYPAKNPTDKSANKKILMLFHYLNPEKPCQ